MTGTEHVGYVRFCLHNMIPVVSAHSSAFCVATHVTARGLRVTQSNEFTKMQSYSHKSIPIAKNSVPIYIETQARGFTKE